MRHRARSLAAGCVLAAGCAGWLAAPALAARAAAVSVVSAPSAVSAVSVSAVGADAVGQQVRCLSPSTRVSQSVPWAEQQLAAQRAWSLTQGAGQLVAVVDSGVSAAAPALSGAVLSGRDMLTGGAGNSDCLGHGTFAAGIVAARPEAGSGFEGLAPRARILPVDVVSPAQVETGDATTSGSAVAAGIRYAVSQGATVIDVSVATTPGSSAALQSAVSYALSHNVVVVAPVGVAGGSGARNTASYPAAYNGVIAVSAVDSSGAPVAAGGAGIRVDLAAPGTNLTSTGPRGRGTVTGAGSSLATAFVAGAAALVRGYYPRLSAAQVAYRLEATADQPGTSVPDPQVGYGIVDPYTAVTTVLPEESGGTAPAYRPAGAVRLAPSPAPGNWPASTAIIVCGAVVLSIVLGAGIARVLRNSRTHGWRPSSPPSAPPAPSSAATRDPARRGG